MTIPAARGEWPMKIVSKQGFTLIELLAVIAIIALLSGIILVNVTGAQKRARDAQRKSDLRQIQAALELYRADNGIYFIGFELPACGTALASGTTVYLRKTPCDPNGATYFNSGRYLYNDISAGARYQIVACLENASDPQGVSWTSSVIPCRTSRVFVVTAP